MDAYPHHYVEHNTPLLVLSGLRNSTLEFSQAASPGSTCISCPVPPVDTPLANALLRCFLATNASGIWSGKAGRNLANSRGPNPVFRVKAIGRDFVLPPRKADLPEPVLPTSPTSESPAVRTLHSPLSPLSPQSPIFPDGVMTHLWMRKHQDLIPSVFIPCFELYTETPDSHMQMQKDNELIKAINDLKKQFGTSISTNVVGSGSPTETNARRTKFMVIILAEKSVLHSPEIDERLGVIRRSTNLENNSTLFFLPSPSSPIEIQSFVRNVQLRLFGSALEHYRDLSKHSRRKRKNPIPLPTVPPTAASTTLSDAGWGIRYEIKLGVFAEFRQEMDTAARSYEIAYESLIQDIMSTTNSWSGRWLEARLLADILSIRVLRCLLWLESWTAAVRRWEYHIIKMRDLIDAKGKGTQTYGFAAWMSTWNRVFAELLQSANLHVFAPVAPGSPNTLIPSVALNSNMQIYIVPEKNVQYPEKISPREHLHHPGFYYLSAANYAADRYARVLMYTESEPFDDYLCSLPSDELTKVDHYGIQIDLFELAKKEFLAKGQKRMGDMMSHNIARLKMERGSDCDRVEASRQLKVLAQTYRQENWIPLLEEVLWRIVEYTKSGDGGQQVAAELELLSSKFSKKKGWTYDLMNCLGARRSGGARPVIALREEDVVPFLSASYTFKTANACVGDAIVSQLVMSSNAHKDSAPVVWSSIKITFEGSLKTIMLTHETSVVLPVPDSSNIRYVDLKGRLQDQVVNHDDLQPSPTSPKSFLTASTDLSLYPGETKIIELSTILREAGEAKAMAATFEINIDEYELEYLVVLQQDDEGWTDELGIGGNLGSGSRKRSRGEVTPSGGNAAWWIQDRTGGFRKKPVRSEEPTALKILPKPPKMEVKFDNLNTPAFIDETIDVRFEICNDEEEEAEASLDVKISGYPENQEPVITWLSPDGQILPAIPSLYPLGRIPATARVPSRFTFPAHSQPIDTVIEITVHYNLLSDPETPIAKSLSVNIAIVSPFSLGHEWAPRVHPDNWPSYFDVNVDLFTPDEEGKIKPTGLTQRWCLTALLTNLEAERETVEGVERRAGAAIVVDDWELQVTNIGDGLQCKPLQPLPKGMVIVLDTFKAAELSFPLDIQRMSFEDRRPSFLETILYIKWRRKTTPGRNTLNTTKIAIPRLPIYGSEPRVLAVAKKAPIPPLHIHLKYTVENPTNYFLTFNLVMEANEAFAFSGPKQSALQLAPLSKVDIRYHIWPFVRNAWIRPVLRVEDRYFNKTLACIPAGARGTMAIDKEKGVGVWVGGWDEGGHEKGDTKEQDQEQQ
ncbi:hypothetical protein L211DRAFT_821552 [Terfezia boudieri ATCC MYA-4762]|uniref:Uncharacterized protein n=1 Tax=Terfezia boudieri ATCC MYA-4762 TaxID=1051890 RepID=A0A3N4LS53_9PEZI|nr:hypothetical protein L211DRAFT_821552 [Terfezia boudieri ATCC MYA-4762]